ncbi:MAG TPA: hypothetical protein VFW22_16380 [Pseudolabrys sp.]|nr:hypothetical protein [Pseudolabrys sp.]
MKTPQQEREEAERATARQLMEREQRFRAIVLSCTHAAIDALDRRDPLRNDGEVHQLVASACSLVLARVYTQDPEIAALRAERDLYREQALQFAQLAPLPAIVIPKPEGEG